MRVGGCAGVVFAWHSSYAYVVDTRCSFQGNAVPRNNNQSPTAQHLVLARWKGGPEIFCSFQGEGRHRGQACVFLRLSRCNLYCVWCDTDYTWNWIGTPFVHRRAQEPGYVKYDPIQETIRLTVAQTADYLKAIRERHLVVTGGEPLLQQPALASLFECLADEAWFVEIETNGTIAPTQKLDRYVAQYNVSPKLKNSGVPLHLRYRPSILTRWALHPRADFKFVVQDENDLEEVEQLVRKHGIQTDRVWIMPQATTQQELLEAKRRLAAAVEKRGYRWGDRLHVALYGSQRGV